MNEFYAMFENDDNDNRLFDNECPLLSAEGICFMLIIDIVTESSVSHYADCCNLRKTAMQ